MSGKGEPVRYSRRRAPKDPREKGTEGDSMSYEELKTEICNLIDTGSGSAAKITIVALVENPENE